MDKPAPDAMTELANAAFRQAAKKVIRRAIETNTPIIVYENEKIVKLDPRTMRPIDSDTLELPSSEIASEAP